MDLFLTVLSIGSFLADIATDIIVIYQYYKYDHFMWLILTTSLVCIPSLIVQIFSIRWFIVDEKATNLVWVIHIFQLGLFYRFFKLLSGGLKARKSKSAVDLEKFNHQQSDICMLRLFESFTESAPQLVLQLYIMVSTDEWNPWTGVSAVASVISLSWGIAAYSKAMRNVRPEKQSLTWWGLLFQSMWRIGMVSSRIVALVLFAVAYGYWLLLAVGIHLLCMITWVTLQKTDFCTTWWEERLYNCVVGIIYCFCFFNLKEGRSRYRMSFYYFVTILQNAGFVLSFYLSETPSHRLRDIMCALVPGGIIIGLFSMLLYYRFFHPSGPILLIAEKTIDGQNVEKPCNKREATANCCTLKTCRKMTESVTTKTESRSPTQSLNIGHQTQPNINRPSSVVKKDNVSIHKSHLFNHTLDRFNKITNECGCYKSKQNALSSHDEFLSCNFRPTGSLSYKSYCSCLVLPQSFSEIIDKNVCKVQLLSISMPHLNFNELSENSVTLETSMHTSGTQESSFSDNESFGVPVIDVDHIITINVEAEK
ncbi:hypothetical protein JTE90_022695 [Oedothorax gibbosus]|uniref:XK-related protein n=1 Tax=Oedothorax gibbosus TaxID=931172 RepID=A0AAV6UKC4_9ARAC|nr:hypothetical protein JTE90_022695 [Oedothorax gibbosus]